MPCFTPEAFTVRTEDRDLKRVSVPCGKCIDCLTAKRASWTIRLSEELRVAHNAAFITLTYNPDTVPYVLANGEILEDYRKIHLYDQIQTTLFKRDLQLYIKRLRKTIDDVEILVGSTGKGLKMRYFAVGEYGSEEFTVRPHYHMLLFNYPIERYEKIVTCWGKGRVDIATDVTIGRIHYISKYMLDALAGEWKEDDPRQKPFQVMSNGIGKTYVDDFKDYHSTTGNPHITLPGGRKHTMPRYLREKLFTKEEREEQSLQSISESDEKWAKEFEKNLDQGQDPFKVEQEAYESRVINTKKYLKSKKT